jgi:hypothetical protein
MLRKLLISIALILPINVTFSQELSLPFPIPEGLKQLRGQEILSMLSGKCITATSSFSAAKGETWDECFEEAAGIGTAAKVHGIVYGYSTHVQLRMYSQPSDWRVEVDYLCYRLQAYGRVDRCRAIAIDSSTNEIVAFDLKEVRERDWENGKWRARMADKWQLFR